jgi:hypothetical protein
MLKSYKIPITVLFGVVLFLALAQIATGTSVSFAMQVAGTLICIGLTYNTLGGLSSISGIAFSGFALDTIVISQFAKALFLEPAQKNLEAPDLTISVYFVFYISVMIGCFVFGRLRVRLPRPVEPTTDAQADLLYVISLVIGLGATGVFEYYNAEEGGQRTQAHSIGLALSSLLLLAIVMGVQARIRDTQGRHSVGIKVLIPTIVTIFFGFINTSRGRMILPAVVYALTCFVSGYKFKFKHYAAALTGIVLFQLFISPLALYSRESVRQEDFRGRIYQAFFVAMNIPSWTVVRQGSRGGSAAESTREEYYDRPGTFVLSRLSAIRADSNMISACAHGYHYGFEALKIELLHNLPHFLYPNKPEFDGAAFTGRITGINPDWVDDTEAMITVVSDSFGAFGWFGVILAGLIAFPASFIIYESMFDIRQPWGIVAVGGFCTVFAQVSLGGLLTSSIRTPIAIVLTSYLVGMILRMIPVKGAKNTAIRPAAQMPKRQDQPGDLAASMD